jgi:hypothetical protein
MVMDAHIYRARDGFLGTIIGRYTTREGVEGVVLQQLDTQVVHCYRATSVERHQDDAVMFIEPRRPLSGKP